MAASLRPTSDSSIAALLLSAGESMRMGQLKALLPFRGKTLIEHQLSSLAEAGVSGTMVVLGHEIDRLEPLLKGISEVRWVQNADYRRGKTTSIKAGVRALLKQSGGSRTGGLLLLNVDQPRNASTIHRIMDAHSRYDEYGIETPPLITIPTYKGKGGHPIIFSASLLEEVMDISEETQGLKAVVRRYEGRSQRFELDTREVLLDLNTPEDYQRARQHFGEV